MKELIDEIEKLKNPILQNTFKEAKETFDNNFKKGIPNHLNRVAIVLNKNEFDDLNLLNQYNIITAPKSIKLSEIVERLNACDKRNKFKKIIKTYETTVVENTEFKKEYIYISKNKIFDLSEYMFKDYYKWLYTLWIAGTEIIDDLKENE